MAPEESLFYITAILVWYLVSLFYDSFSHRHVSSVSSYLYGNSLTLCYSVMLAVWFILSSMHHNYY